MRNLLFYAVSLILVLFFTSCNKNMGTLDPSYFKTNPSPLEVKAGVVSVDISGQYPAKYFNKNAVVTVTPVLKFAGQELKGTPKSFQGEKIKGNEQMVANKAGGTFTMRTAFNYVPEMVVSELYLQFDVVQKSKKYQIPTVKIADGVIATSTLLSTSSDEITPVIINDKFQRVIEENEGADVLFLIQQAELRKSEKTSTDIVNLIKRVKDVQNAENLELKKFEISGYASPEGGYDLNKGLSEQRQKVTAGYINSELKKLKTKVAIESKVTAEDWDGFQQLVQTSTMQDKNTILRVLSSYSDSQQREREIRNLSSAYTQIADEVLPQLRRARLTLTYNVVGKSDEEISQLANNNPSELSVEELLYAATLTSDLNAKASIYKKVISQYTNDVRGYNNLGQVRYAQGNIDDAYNFFAKAAQLDPASADVNFNMGLVALTKGDRVKSEEYFAKAKGTSGNLNLASGSLYTAKGEYDKAKTAFTSEISNNVGLLQILNADYTGALKTLNAVSAPDATTAYLKAIAGARTNNKDLVYSNLKTAIQLDNAYAAKAQKDIEFAKFVNDAAFLSILK